MHSMLHISPRSVNSWAIQPYSFANLRHIFDWQGEMGWFLQAGQEGMAPVFLDHIKRGVQETGIHTRAHTQTHTHTHRHTHTHTRAHQAGRAGNRHTHTRAHTDTHTHTYIHTHTHTHTYTHSSTSSGACRKPENTDIHACANTHTHTHTHAHTCSGRPRGTAALFGWRDTGGPGTTQRGPELLGGCSHCIRTVCTLYSHCIRTVCTLYSHCIRTVRSRIWRGGSGLRKCWIV
jgi:hypothetical protein